jgi:Bacterial Ig-like domain
MLAPLEPAMMHVPSRRTSILLSAGAVLAAALVAVTPAVPAGAAPVTSCVSRDNGDPVLSALSFTPGSVNVTTGGKVVTATAQAADTGGPGAASGIGNFSVSFSSPNFADYAFISFAKNAAGDWVGKTTIPRWSTPGTWNMTSVSLSDKAGNYRYYGVTELTALGVDTTLEVTSTADTTPPSLAAFTFSPGSVNSTTGPKVVTVTAKANDSQSGVSYISVSASKGGTGAKSIGAYLTKVSGTVNTYRGKMTVPRWWTSGTWRVTTVYLIDRADNQRLYTYAQLGSLHFKRDLAVVSGTDTGLPNITSYSRTPGTVDVRTGNKSVAVTARLTDTKAGVSYAVVSFRSVNGFGAVAYLHRVSGTAANGVWKGTAVVSRCSSEAGSWQTSIDIADMAGNTRHLTPANVAAKGWPKAISVQAGDHRFPIATMPVTFDVPVAGPVNVTFNEAVNGIDSDNVVVREDTFPTPGPAIAGTWACLTGAGASTSCTTGQVRTASFTPTVPLDTNSYYQLTLNPEHRLGVTDLAGNPFDRRTLYFSTPFA